MYSFDSRGGAESLQNLTLFEQDWILNEQLLVMCDAMYALKNYMFVKDEENVIRRFDPRLPQQLLFDIISDLEMRGFSIELMILKARQLGMSTLVELLIAHRIIFSHGINAVIGSADQTKTRLMSNMLFLAYDMLPVWLRPVFTSRVESDRGQLVFGHQMSGVSFQHGAQASGIARGTTPTLYHLSECASFSNPVEQIEASLFKAVHASPHVFGVLESTGEGDKGWWPDTWRDSKSKWAHGRSRLCPIFLPWFCGVGMYPNATFMRMHPIPSDWRPSADTRTHVAKSELYVQSSPLLERHLLKHQHSLGDTRPRWRMPLDQQWWWEIEHEQAKSKGIESIFLQEMAGDDEEALQRSVESVFGHDVISLLDERRERHYEMFTISGQSIEDTHEIDPAHYDYDAKRIPVRYRSPVKEETYRWELIPLRSASAIREDDPSDADGVLFIYHHPTPGVSYSIGVDTSGGKGKDSTVVSVWTCGSRTQPDVQCAEFAASRVGHVEAFAFAMAIAAYYRTTMERGVTRWNEPYVSIEQVAAVGDTCQLQMKKMGYRNFHRMTRYDGKNVSKIGASKQGWYTFGWSRPLLTGNFVHSARNGWAEINSPWLIEEMKTFEVHHTSTGKEKMEHEEGEHDDRIFAAAMAIFCPHDLDTLAERSKNRMQESSTLPPIDVGEYGGQVVTARTMRTSQNPVLSLDDMLYDSPRDLERFMR